jgi:hypothetical protein
MGRNERRRRRRGSRRRGRRRKKAGKRKRLPLLVRTNQASGRRQQVWE